MVGVFRVGDAKHLNNVELGRHGRSRSNVWHYAGVNTFRAGRMDELAVHPTVKPVAMVADALKDCTRRGDIVLDTFAGAGTTILAAERVGRRAYSLELEPKYVDVAIRRWQAFTRRDAVHADTGQTFEDVAGGRKDAQPAPSAPQIRARTGEGRIMKRKPSRRAAKDAPYEIGYCKPPKHTRFKPGQSGHPSGRPRGQRNFRTAVREALKEKITIREGDRTRTVSKMDAIIQVTFNKALKGDAKSPRCLSSSWSDGRA